MMASSSAEDAGGLRVVAEGEMGQAESPARSGAQVGRAVGLGDLDEGGGDGHRCVCVTAAVQDSDADGAAQDVRAGVLGETRSPADALLGGVAPRRRGRARRRAAPGTRA